MSFTKLKSAVTLGIIAFVIMNLQGFYSMPTDGHGKMFNCPFMGVATVCQMNSLEHIAAWQNMFTALPQKDIFAFLVLLILILFAIILLRNFLRVPLKEFLSAEAIRYKRTNTLFIPHPLQWAFSDGILHTKIF